MKKILAFVLVFAFILPITAKAFDTSNSVTLKYISNSGPWTVLSTKILNTSGVISYTIPDGQSHSYVISPSANWITLDIAIPYSTGPAFQVSIPFSELFAQIIGVDYGYLHKTNQYGDQTRYGITRTGPRTFEVLLRNIPICCPW